MNNKVKNNIVHITLGIILMTFLLPLKVKAAAVGDVKNFGYTGGIQTFTAPATGYYKLETWGAQGGSSGGVGGYGAYSVGTVFLNKGKKLYVVVGGAGGVYGDQGSSEYRWVVSAGGYNGGGSGYSACGQGGGGGATHIATSSGLLSTFSSNKQSLLITSGGGGGAYHWKRGNGNGGAAGGYTTSAAGNTYSYGSFGQGGSGRGAACGGGGGGGGYLGGNGGGNIGVGGGGSSYIGNSLLNNKVTYCYYCSASTTVSNKTVSTTCVSSTATANCSKSGSGYSRITISSLSNTDARLSSLEVTNATFDTPFSPNTYEYNLIVDSENYEVNITGSTFEDTTIVNGLGTYTLESGTNKITIIGTADSGDVAIYTLNVIRPASSYKYLNNITIDGEPIENFNPETLEYTVNLSYEQDEIDLQALFGRPSQSIDGTGKISLPSGNSTREIQVISEDRTSTTTYTIHFVREHSSKLKTLSIDDYELEPKFNSDTTEYILNIMNSTLSLNVNALAYDEEAKISYSGFGYIKSSTTGTITVTEPNCAPTVYKVNIIKGGTSVPTTYDFEYTGTIQTFTAPALGYYKLETWGSQGGSSGGVGGYGAYSVGAVYLKKGETIYVVVGGAGGVYGDRGSNESYWVVSPGGYNGGGSGYSACGQGGGGGATHISTTAALLSSLSSNTSSILIASGGGGGAYHWKNGNGNGNSAGGYATSAAGYTYSYGSFGQGGSGRGAACGGGGGGGGYLGGNGGGNIGYGGGGSSYIGNTKLLSYKETTKVMYCYNCQTSENESTYTETTKNYSVSPTSYYAKSGNGYARITLLAQPSENNFLSAITTDKGTLTPSFNMATLDYSVQLTSEDDEITIGARLEDDTATLTGVGAFDVPAGTTEFPITVTAENGNIRVYTISVTRPVSSNEKPTDIVISGLVPSLCSANEKYCKLSDAFSTDIHTYTITVPSRIKQLQFTVIKGHEYQKVTGEGIVSLEGGMNTITIEIMSEDGQNTATYTYNIERDMTGNANIETLEVVNPVVDINFDPDITDYYFSIPNENTNVDLNIVLEDPNATYEVIGNENFEVGLNIVTINVTAQNKETKAYTLNIYREQSGNTFLNNLTVSHDGDVYQLNPTFNKILSTYTVNVPNEIDNVLIDATAEHSLTTINGLGEYNLKTGTNTFQIVSTSENGSVQIYTISVIREKNSDATLKSLDVLEATLSPIFESDIFEYYIDVNPGVTNLHLNPVPNSDVATYKISGNSGFKVGEDNIVEVTVIAENGNKKIYKIHVNRLPSTNTYLSYLNTEQYDISTVFNKKIEEYDIELENNVTSISVNAIPEDSLSTVIGTGNYSLTVGDNSIFITVLAENGDRKTYTLHVFRKYNSNANLISLSTSSLSEYAPTFSKDETNYLMEVENSEDKITVLGVAESPTSKIAGNGEYQLSVGTNPINIVVTAEDGTTKTYTLTVVRKPSSNANASMIIAKESFLDPSFDKNVTDYVLKVEEDITSLNLSVTLEDSNATYEVIGNENFVIGNNTVIVKITAEDGTEKNYILNVLRQSKGTTSNRLIDLSIDKGTLSPAFDSDINYYEVEVPYSITNVVLSGELEDKNATVSGFGQYQLEIGQNALVVEVTSVEGKVRYYQVIVTRKPNDEARLSNLQIAGTTISPNFNKDTYEYSLSTALTELNIIAVPIDSNATYEIIGNQNLNLGNNQVIIKVTAQDKVTTKEYVLNIEKEKSNNNNLKSLEIEGQTFSPAFSKTTTVYYMDVEEDIKTIQVNAIAEDINAKVTGDGEINLSVGTNYVEITVTSESGKSKVYTVIVNRKGNSNNYLENLTVSNGDLNPSFEKTVNDYTVTVPYVVEEITVDGTLEDQRATVVGFDKYDLEVGINKILVTVTAEDGTTNIYSITVIREEIVSSKLKDLIVKDYKLNQVFNSDVYDYNLLVDNEVTSLDLKVIPIDKNATYVIEGNENFIVGMNEVKIIVTDRMGLTTSTYVLNVNRQNYANTYLAYIYADKGTLSPTFEKTTLSYTIEVENDVEEINISAEPEITTNTLTGTGTYKLESGNNRIALTVSTSTGVSRTYYVNVIRKKKTYNHLTSLEVKANGEIQTLEPTFNKDTLSYKTIVAAGTPNVQIIATAEDGATISGSGNKMIKLGDNSFDIVVTAEDGSIKTYNLIVTREASTNNNLIDIIPSVGTLTPSFNYTNNEYSIKLDSSASLLSFSVTTEDRFATVTGIDAQVIPDGESIREIIVTAENGSTKTYTVHVYKDRTDEARLSSLKMSGYTFDTTFDKDIFNYKVTVPNNKNVVLSSEIEAVPLDKNATVTKTSSLVLSSLATNIYTIIVTAEDGFTTQTYTISIEREKGNDSSLSKLAFDYGEMSPTFIPTTTEYTLKLPKGITTIKASDVEAIPTDEDATVNIIPAFEFSDENNVYEIVVLSADQSSTTTYTIHLERLQSNDATLKELTVSSGTLNPVFNRTTLNYTIDVTDITEEITIEGTPNDEKGIILNGVGTHKLEKDSETISITVQAEDGTINIYNITVNKSITTEKLLSDLYLSGACTKDTCPLTPDFNEEILEYKAVVENEITNVDIAYVKKHEGQKVRVYNYQTEEEIGSTNLVLKTGSNIFRVDVENGVGDVTSYKLTINRKLSSNNYLKILEITTPSTELNFDKETTEYFVTIPNEYDSITLNYEAEVSTSTVLSSGTKYLTPGNNDVYVIVTAENGNTRTYIIHVEKEKDYNNYLQSLTVSSGVIYELIPKFNKSVTDYTVTVPYDASIVTLEGVPELSSTTVSGSGEKSLKVGINIYTLTTTAKTGEVLNYNVVINRKKSSKLYLKTLKINNANLLETFNKEKFSYNVEADPNVTSLDMIIVPEQEDVTYKVVGNNNLVAGSNTILIILENSDKTVTTTYKLTVNKLPSSDNLLKSLKVDDKELINSTNYDSSIFETVVSSDKESVDITAVANSLNAKIEGNGTYSLDYGDNSIQIKVIAEDGSILVYEVNVKREYDNNLLMISTDRGDLTPTFDKDTLDYYLNVERDITDITVLAVQSSDLTTLTGNGYYKLSVGENLIYLTVSSSDGSSKTYTLHINRKLSDNNYLKKLYVHEGFMKEEFNKETLEYNLEVPDNISSLTIDIEVEDKNATYEIIGNENLVSGDNIVKVIVTAENGNIRTYTLNVLVQEEAEFSNRLKSLTVNKGTLAPNFEPDTLSYTVTVGSDVSSITLSGILESVDAKVVGLGTHELKSGRNEIPVTVTSKDHKTRTYSVIVYRIESNDPRLKSVSFKEGILSPLFDKDTDAYTITVDSSVYKLTETVIPLANGTTYEIIGNENLQTGTTDIQIIATAEDKKTTKTYTITVTKEQSTNNYLDSLSTNIGIISPEFDKTNTGPYIINVDDAVNSIILNGKPSVSTSTVTGLGVHQINKGKNTISITVTSETGSTRTYTVIVNKSLSNDNSLMFLGVSDGDLEPSFDPDTLTYNLEVESAVEELTVLGLAKDKNATVEGNGNYILSNDNNEINIIVTAENGDVRTYTINVIKNTKISSKLLDIKSQEGKLTPEFDKNTLEYIVTVPNEVTSLTLDITKEDENATYEIVGNSDFIVGSNQVKVIVTATDNTTTTYILNIIRQQSANNYLKELNISNGTLTPEFSKEQSYYEISVENNVSNITINGIAEDNNATVTGNGSYTIDVGDNYIYVDVTSATGVVRTYTIKVNRKESSSNILNSLSINPGELTPSFDPNINNYTVNLDEGVSEIEITATADEKANITGLGTFAVLTGDNAYEVIVTAEDGTINTYTIHATKASSSNNNITNIIPSSGILSPNYSNDISSYEVLVEEDVSMIDFEVLLESSLATVTGNKDIYLDYGDNDVLIKVEAEDGSIREVHINVIREKNITDIIVDKDTILMAVGENYQLNPKVLPEDATNKELIYESSNTEVATVEDGLIVAKKIGDTQITISSAKNKDIKKVVQVTVINLQLESSVYEVRKNDINIVIGAEEGESLSTFLSNMDNNQSLIRFYDNDANQIMDLENTRVATGQLITLEYNNQIYDQAWIVLRGDSSCDSNINVTDYTILVEQVLGKKNLEGYLFPSVDVEEDQVVDVTDSIKLTNYILGKLDSLNKSNSGDE